jgi:hypothetical protein
VILALQEAAHFVFTHAFVDAMRPTLILPIALLIVAALATFFVRADKPASAAERVMDDAEAVA